MRLRARACAASAKPSPSPTPLIAWIEHIAPARRPSRRSSQETCEPRPGTRPNARTSKTPPSDSLALPLRRRCARPSPPRRRRRGSAPARRRRRRSRSPAERLRVARRAHRADLQHVRDDLDAERAQERLAQRAAGDAGGGLAGAGPLEHVAHVGEPVLHDSGEVGVAGTREVDLLDLRLDRPRVHPLRPVRVVAVGDRHRDRPAERAAVAHTRRRLGGVALDLHAPAAAVAELAARHVAVDRLAVEREARGQPFEHAGEAGAVRLPGGDHAQQRHRLLESTGGRVSAPRSAYERRGGAAGRLRRRPRAAPVVA